MYPLDQQAFQPVGSSHASFNSSALGATSAEYALESTGVREFPYPSSRSVRLVGLNAVPYFAKFGSTAVRAGSTDSMLLHGGTPEIVTVAQTVTYVSVVSSTTITVNVTLGVGQ